MKFRTLFLSLAAVAASAAVYAFQPNMQMPTAGAEHKALQRAVGNWDATLDMGEGEPSKGTMLVEAGPGGFTILSHFKADMGGMPFEGRAIDGYDPIKKKFVSVWADSMTPAPMFSEGTWDEKSQTLTMHGDMLDQGSGKIVKHKLTTKWTGNDHMDFNVSVVGAEGKDVTTLKIAYVRKK